VTQLPIAEPGKVLCRLFNHGAEDQPEQPVAYLKDPDGAVPPGGVLRLPPGDGPLLLERELAVVVKGPVKRLPRERWREAVFGYTCFLDVVRPPFDELGETWQKSFDTRFSFGPTIALPDERLDALAVERAVPELIELLTTVMTLESGDLLASGADEHDRPRVSPGYELAVEIEGIGRLAVTAG
jgi:2-keto-4-pentenoate hydratase/2-oxohepta-3-ene-1,7-dioic acid hydratase in catechol pathway